MFIELIDPEKTHGPLKLFFLPSSNFIYTKKSREIVSIVNWFK